MDTMTPPLGMFRGSELILGLVYPVGTYYNKVVDTLQNLLRQFDYDPNVIHLSEHFDKFLNLLKSPVELKNDCEAERIKSRMMAGNWLREHFQQRDFVSRIGILQIYEGREWKEGQAVPERRKRTCHILLSLKRPEEVESLRKVYGPGFFLIGISSTRKEREDHLQEKGVNDALAAQLIDTDEDEKDDDFGQKTRDTFYLSDVFVTLKGDEFKRQLTRFLDLVFGYPYSTPDPDEYAMFMAYAASLRSGDLSRQVGAALMSSTGDIIAVGCNDVPSFGGGLYWPGQNDQRDFVLGKDTNEEQRNEIAKRILARTQSEAASDDKSLKELFSGTELFDITEYGRTVHAEMDALLTCARTGVSTRDATLYTTTFPCHNCTRHIITAGIKRVVYIEPYPKSRALTLHADAASLTKECGKLSFEPFIGIGPRRYFDLFSLALSTGYPISRKENGRVIQWDRASKTPRVPLQPSSYLQRELLATKELKKLFEKQE